MLCNDCPRKCNIDRTKVKGFCGENGLRIAHVMLHHFEEPPISGARESDKGSGAIFFSGCNLKCCYCQNYQISHEGLGENISREDLIDLFKSLENAGAYNINLVTPTHFSSEIINALKIYKPKIPVVWNTSGFESAETIKKLDGLVDIFLTDIRYFSDEYAKKYSEASGYFADCIRALRVMRDIAPTDKFDENGLMKSGIIIRLLVLPNLTGETIKILDWINKNLGNETYISLMNQYYPCYRANKFPEINRKVSKIEYNRVVRHAINLGFKNAYIQESSSATSEFTPCFSGKAMLEKSPLT